MQPGDTIQPNIRVANLGPGQTTPPPQGPVTVALGGVGRQHVRPGRARSSRLYTDREHPVGDQLGGRRRRTPDPRRGEPRPAAERRIDDQRPWRSPCRPQPAASTSSAWSSTRTTRSSSSARSGKTSVHEQPVQPGHAGSGRRSRASPGRTSRVHKRAAACEQPAVPVPDQCQQPGRRNPRSSFPSNPFGG